MKNIILTTILSLLVSVTSFAGTVSDSTKRESNVLFVTEDSFSLIFMQEIKNYIETGDTSNFNYLINDDDMAFLSFAEYNNSEDKNYFFDFLKRHLNIKTKGITVIPTKEDDYLKYEFPDGKGGIFNFHIFYPNSDRYDVVTFSYGENARMISLSIMTEVNKNPYHDGNIGRMVGGEFGPNGEEVEVQIFDYNK